MTAREPHHPPVDLAALQAMPTATLAQQAMDAGLDVGPGAEHGDLVFAVFVHRVGKDGFGHGDGTFDLLPDGFGFVRSKARSWAPAPFDAFVSPAQVRRLNLKNGHHITGPVRAPRGGERFLALQHVETVNGGDPERLAHRIAFASRSPVLPRRGLALDPNGDDELAAIAALAPWARGHRVLVTAPPSAPSATLLARLAAALHRSDAELVVTIALLDQRPEDLAAARAAIVGTTVDLVATTFDAEPSRHSAVAEMALAEAQRDVEAGRDVVLLLDSLTAFARACHVDQPTSGKLACVGLDALATLRGKKLFSAARACEEGGSLTIVATAIENGDRIDDTILADFRRRANSEVAFCGDPTLRTVVLDVRRTATRPEDLLLPPPDRLRLDALRNELAQRSEATPTALAEFVRSTRRDPRH